MSAEYTYEVGTRVYAPNGDDVVKSGRIRIVLTSMYFVEFDDGTEDYCYKVDKRLQKVKDSV